jgi:hypothetical protein
MDVQEQVEPPRNLVKDYNELTTKRVKHEIGAEAFERLADEEKARLADALPEADKRMAAMLVKRDAFNLADSLAPLTGRTFSHYVFGIGVLGMALSAATMLMLINGLCFCEMLNLPAKGWPQRIGSLMVSVGVLGAFFWRQAAFWLAVPTSVFAMALLPIAYFSFYFLMNQKTLMGDNMPRGGRRVLWNVLMAVAASAAAFGSVWSLWSRLRFAGIGILVAFVGLALLVHAARRGRRLKTT